MIRSNWFGVLLLLGAVPSCSEQQPPKAAPPHVVFILLDDLGWNDIGYHGSDVPTPEMDRLSADGLRLEAFYALPLCTPSRAALLTGRHPLRFGLQDAPLRHWHEVGIPPEETTLAEALRGVGYRTHIVGKWHLGNRSPHLPLENGFDHHYGLLELGGSYFERTIQGRPDWWRDGAAIQERGYTTDLLGEEAVRIIENHEADRPLFLYVPFSAVHTPLDVRPKIFRHARFDHISDPKRRLYAAVAWAADAAIGRIAEALEARGWSEETLFVVCSDNGAADYQNGSNLPLRDGKMSLYEGGVRVPAFCRFPGRLPEGQVIEEPTHLVDWFATLARLAGVPRSTIADLDGRDLWPLLSAGDPLGREELILNASPYGSAIRRGDWKLIEVPAGAEGEERRRELYDLASDPTEERDLSAQQPAVLQDLRARLEAWQGRSRPLLVPRIADDDQKPDQEGR